MNNPTKLSLALAAAVGLVVAISAQAAPDQVPPAAPGVQTQPVAAPGVSNDPLLEQAGQSGQGSDQDSEATVLAPAAVVVGGPAVVAPAGSATGVVVAPTTVPATTPPAQALPAALVGPAPTVPPASDPTLSMSNDDLVRTIARLNTRRDVLAALSALDDAQAARELSLIQDEIDKLLLREKLANGGKEPSAAPAAATVPGGVLVAPGVMGAAPVVRPVVRSIYGFGGRSYAEIYVGSAKIVATEGTVLASGETVVDISPSGVVLLKKGRRSVLQVAGSAGTTPVSYSSPQGLPGRP